MSSNAQEREMAQSRPSGRLRLWLGRMAVSASPAGRMGLIFSLSSLEPASVPGTFSTLGWLRDIIAHAVLYAALGGLALLTLWAWIAGARRRLLWMGVAVLSGLLYGVLDEVHQSFVPGRESSPLDVFVDTLGAVLGVLAVRGLAQPAWRWARLATRSLPKR